MSDCSGLDPASVKPGSGFSQVSIQLQSSLDPASVKPRSSFSQAKPTIGDRHSGDFRHIPSQHFSLKACIPIYERVCNVVPAFLSLSLSRRTLGGTKNTPGKTNDCRCWPCSRLYERAGRREKEKRSQSRAEVVIINPSWGLIWLFRSPARMYGCVFVRRNWRRTRWTDRVLQSWWSLDRPGVAVAVQ